MKLTKIIGVLFIAFGLLFAILGAIRYIITFTERDDRIYTTALITEIDKRETGDPEFPTDYTIYVELEVDGKKITSELNTARSTFKTGDLVDIYYFENDLQTVYKTGSNGFYIIFTLGGLAFAAVGAALAFGKKHSAQ